MKPDTQLPRMKWGEEPEFFGPRHHFREGMIVREVRRRIAPGSRLLDAGCGNGSLSLRLAEAGYRVMGLDRSPEFVRYGRERLDGARKREAVSFQEGDICDTGLPEHSFDAVTCGEVLEHIQDDAAAVRELLRVLRPGGVCVVTVPCNPALWDENDVWAGHHRRYTHEGLVGLFEKGGFRVDRCVHWGFPLVRLFHSMVYLPMVRRRFLCSPTGGAASRGPLPAWMRSRGLHRLVAALFSVDRLFEGTPWGIGLLLVAEKNSHA